MTNTDLVVVLPGIMGSTLNKDNKLVWAPSAGSVLRAVFTLGRSLTQLRLPPGVEDGHPGDGVEPVDLMPDLHAIPGIWTPIKGYDGLLRRLRSLTKHGKIGEVMPVAYDWRLSNRYSAERLASIVDPALERWRSSSPERADAQLVFVCHSMGGLVARWYIEKCGGAEVTRKLVTLGTPYRGSAKAVEQLVNGVSKGIGPLSVDLTEFARSLPSLHQLLPGYACIDHDGSLHHLGETTVPELNTVMVQDAMGFHADLAAAEAARPASLTMTHAIVGVRQPTWTSLRLSGGGVEALDTIGGANDFGDGTVPRAGSIGHDLPMDTNTVRRVVDQHGNLQANPWALDELEEVLAAEPVRRRAGATVPVRVGVPDLILTGELLPVVVDVEADRPPAVRIQIVAEGEPERIVASRTPRIRDGHLDTSFAGLAPGAYEVRVTGLGTGSPVSPVTAPVLVWPPEPFQRRPP
jgi:pimeloyl-ACP methyl ester carboxylesterase